MKTLADQQADRQAAGATYQAAAAALLDAFVELAAQDRAVANRAHFDHSTPPLRSFHGLLELPAHPDFSLASAGSLEDAIRARLAALLA